MKGRWYKVGETHWLYATKLTRVGNNLKYDSVASVEKFPGRYKDMPWVARVGSNGIDRCFATSRKAKFYIRKELRRLIAVADTLR